MDEPPGGERRKPQDPVRSDGQFDRGLVASAPSGSAQSGQGGDVSLFRRIGFWLALTLSVLIAALMFDEAITALVAPGGYPFGWENGGWRYRTQTNSAVSALAQGLVASLLIAAALVFRRRRPPPGCGFAVLPIVLLLAWTIDFWQTLD